MRRLPALLLALPLLAACSLGVSSQNPSSGAPASIPPSTMISAPPMTEALEAAIRASTPAAPITLPDDNVAPLALDLPPAPAAPAAAHATRTPRLADAKNLDAITDAYGITLTDAQQQALGANGFVVLPLTETSIVPEVRMTDREFAGLYRAVRGSNAARDRTQANSVFYSSDVFLSGYNRLYEELIKEVENTVFFVQMQKTTEQLLDASRKKLAAAATDAEKLRWTKVRDYFAIPHCILQTGKGLENPMLNPDGTLMTPDENDTALQDAIAMDKKLDAETTVAACIRAQSLGASEQVVLDQIAQLYAAEGPDAPVLFADEFEAYRKSTDKEFKVDFSQFTPRSHYTGSSMRRQYFRGMSWYIQVPFFLREPQLSSYAFGVAELLASDPALLEQYQRLERTITTLVGSSDDLRPTDYLRAIEDARGKPNTANVAMAWLDARKGPQVKSMGVAYNSIGTEDTAQVLDLTKGMRFFSGKVLRDSTWTGRLTQGDEKPLPGFTQKLPPMASSLEVMGLLGSDYARSRINVLPFVTPDNRDAVTQMMGMLTEETNALPDSVWQTSTYHTAMWSIQGMFQWEKANRAALPAFMRTPAWEAKTLQAGAGSWTELRHATLLYAKQSFAEMGAGWEDYCDPDPFPEPAKGYIEPQPLLYNRLQALAKATNKTLADQGFTELRNSGPLDRYVTLLDTVRSYSEKELADAVLAEKRSTKEVESPEEPGKQCTVTTITESDWETIRLLANAIADAQPVVVEGDVLQPKDRRAALIADVHTGGDSTTPPNPGETRVLYQALGVPSVILALVEDANGARATIGFTYRHYEFTTPLEGKRLTDEQWQEKFYAVDPYDPFLYTAGDTWPAQPEWYSPISGGSAVTAPASSSPQTPAPPAATPGTGA